ncbi:RNA cap guanine-N2 methyltransferase [Diplocarpon rosae]|nr:RNA cap guanine-N2 methyltransferase [Diplocarpon rosae]
MASTQVLKDGPKDIGKVTKKGKKKKQQQQQQQSISQNSQTTAEDTMLETVPQLFELTDECHHYTARNQIEYDIQKYWEQRYSIWSLYDDGIYMTDDAWFGVTPEPVANQVAKDFAARVPASRTVLIDMFAGAGGNVIAFALSQRWCRIIAIEKNPAVLACAYHNAQIYGVADQITWVNDDSFAYLACNPSSHDPSTTAVFASPPWGGPGYRDDEIFNLSRMQPYSLGQIHDVVRTMDAALYLPRQSDVRQVARLAPEGKKIEVVQYCMMGASKAMVAYIPAASPPCGG